MLGRRSGEPGHLAGVRLIFYTNADANRFLEMRVIPQHFSSASG
jgi:hypothetical protein